SKVPPPLRTRPFPYTTLFRSERFSHVTHLVSEVAGELGDGVSPFELLRASFPAGTVSGAPKVRAMQIISELEGYRRGPYAGAVRSGEHTSELQSLSYLVCRLL